MALSNSVDTYPRTAVVFRLSPIMALVASAALFMLLIAPVSVSAQQSGGGLFGGLFGGNSSPAPRTGRYRSSPYSSYNDSWLGSWSDSYSPVPQASSRYRTLCVRTCDGYYFPISFSTTRTGLARDAQQCEARCGAPAKLFYHRNPGADVEHMVDLSGQPYAQMENAFRYRTEIVDSCRCTPEPWSEAAKEEYERRAQVAANPELATTTLAEAQSEPDTPTQAEVAGWRRDAERERAEKRRARNRHRYRANDPAHDGKWWASSW